MDPFPSGNGALACRPSGDVARALLRSPRPLDRTVLGGAVVRVVPDGEDGGGARRLERSGGNGRRLESNRDRRGAVAEGAGESPPSAHRRSRRSPSPEVRRLRRSGAPSPETGRKRLATRRRKEPPTIDRARGGSKPVAPPLARESAATRLRRCHGDSPRSSRSTWHRGPKPCRGGPIALAPIPAGSTIRPQPATSSVAVIRGAESLAFDHRQSGGLEAR